MTLQLERANTIADFRRSQKREAALLRSNAHIQLLRYPVSLSTLKCCVSLVTGFTSTCSRNLVQMMRFSNRLEGWLIKDFTSFFFFYCELHVHVALCFVQNTIFVNGFKQQQDTRTLRTNDYSLANEFWITAQATFFHDCTYNHILHLFRHHARAFECTGYYLFCL